MKVWKWLLIKSFFWKRKNEHFNEMMSKQHLTQTDRGKLMFMGKGGCKICSRMQSFAFIWTDAKFCVYQQRDFRLKHFMVWNWFVFGDKWSCKSPESKSQETKYSEKCKDVDEHMCETRFERSFRSAFWWISNCHFI